MIDFSVVSHFGDFGFAMTLNPGHRLQMGRRGGLG